MNRSMEEMEIRWKGIENMNEHYDFKRKRNGRITLSI